MTSTSLFKREDLREQLPDENAMLERRGFQTRGFRRELGPDVLPINATNGMREVESGDKQFVSENSDLSLSPTALGEAGGAVGLTEVRGDKFNLYRNASHVRIEEEDEDVDADNFSEKQRVVMEFFDLAFDKWVFDGVEDENGNTVRTDIFSELKTGIPTARSVDCSSLDVGTDLNGEVANLFREHLYSMVEGHYFEDSWATLVAKHPVHASFNRLDTHDGAAIFTEYELVSGERVPNVPGLVDRRIRVPKYLGPATENGNKGELTFDISSLGDDEALLLPAHNGDFMQMWEQGSPDVRDPIDVRGWGREVEYKTWGGHAFDQDIAAGGDEPVDDSGERFPDAFHLTNVSSLWS